MRHGHAGIFSKGSAAVLRSSTGMRYFFGFCHRLVQVTTKLKRCKQIPCLHHTLRSKACQGLRSVCLITC